MQRKKGTTKWTTWLILAAAGAAALAYAFWPRAVRVDIERVTRGPIRVTVDEDGKTRIKERYVVAAPLAGRLERIELEPGDPVEADVTVLAAITPPPATLLDPRARLVAQARVLAAEAAVQQSSAQRDGAQESHDLSVHNLERAKVLMSRGTITREEFDTIDHRERVLGSELRSAEFAEKVASHALELAKASLAWFDGDAGPDSRLEIRSPVSGRVLRVMQESATTVNAGDPLLEVGDPTDLEVEVDLLSSDAVQVRPGARVTLEAWGGDRPLEGAVRYVEPAAYLKVSALGIEEQRVNVIIDLLEPLSVRQQLGDAYRVEAKITVWETDSALVVPLGALFRKGDSWAVFAVEQGRARLKAVKIGRGDSAMSVVEDGLRQGEQVIVHPSDTVDDGVRIRPR